ncbi:MAG: FAD-dependent oxidoreductase [Deltaproteobacteria bacterium]|jgi:NADPH-dependent 2,4-dienoyl-CoA reductase/sulfur reductase-like enzyme/rhodanese-related sulfurtransferase
MRLVVVGGVAGGATAATRARRLSEDADIVLFERGFYVSYANCGLPYYIGGEIEKRDDLFIASPERLRSRYRIDVRTSQEVIEIDRSKKEVTVEDHATGEKFRQRYDKLILSPGARPTKPPLPGVDSDKVFTLRDLPDSDSIKDYLDRKGAESAVVVGGGFIGLESVENFSRHGVRVTVIEKMDQLMPSLDYDMAALVHRHLRDQDIGLYLSDGVESFHEKENRLVVGTEKGMHIETDLALLAIGVRPEKELAEKAGLAIGKRGGIVVDGMLRTSDPDIYAIGDAIEVKDLVSGEKRLLALAGPANRQGRAAADNIMGRESKFAPVLGTNITRIFNLVAASTGDKEEKLKHTGEQYLVSFTHSYHHASYYPGAKSMAIKLIFSPDRGKILGAQIVGEAGVDKRIDVLSTAIRAGMTVYDLEELELAYAPQFGSAKDPVNIAGFVAANILKGDVQVVHWNELDGLNRNENVLLDVRTLEEVKGTGTIMDAVHIHVDQLRDRLDELDRKKTYVAYCTVSLRGYIAYRILVQKGFKAKILSGGMETWSPIQEDRLERAS